MEVREASAEYLVAADQCVPVGYKQTEVGVIPEDWGVSRLGDLFEITSSKRVFQSEWKTEGVPFYRAREIAVLSETGFVDNDLFISKQMYDAFRRVYGAPQVGDLLVTGVGTLGKVYVVPDDREFYFKDGNIIWFKIADNLSSATSADYAFNYISLEDVDLGSLRSYSEQIFYSAPSRARRRLRTGDILVSTVRPNLQSHLLFTFAQPNWICSTGFSVVRCKMQDATPGFIFFHLFGHLVAKQIETLLAGSNYPAINGRDVKALEIPMPLLTEQTAIATILSDMDAEIAALEERLAKSRQIKQGMMQELLTGKIRLIRPVTVVIPFQANKESAKASKSHNWQINEAVVIAVLAKNFGSEQWPLGRKRYTKFSYLMHRHVERKVEGYLKQAAGPYNPATKYKGPEGIALKNGYVRFHSRDQFSGFVAAEKIVDAEDYFSKWYGAEVLGWLEQFRRKSNDELELLSTVDMAMEDLRRDGKVAELATVKQVIQDHPEWEAKLEREIFSDDNITRAIGTCRELLA
jgi:hypothetical protein